MSAFSSRPQGVPSSSEKLPPIDDFFLAIKLRTYRELQKNHLEDALMLIRKATGHIAKKYMENSGGLTLNTGINSVYLFWLRGNYFHLVTDRAKALDNYYRAHNRLVEIILKHEKDSHLISPAGQIPVQESSQNEKSSLALLESSASITTIAEGAISSGMDVVFLSDYYGFLNGLIHSDLGDFHWYSDATDLSIQYYRDATKKLIPEFTIKAYADLGQVKKQLAELLGEKYSSVDGCCDASTWGASPSGGNEASLSDLEEDGQAWSALVALKRVYMELRCLQRSRDSSNKISELESNLGNMQHSDWVGMPSLPFMVGQQVAANAPYTGSDRPSRYHDAMKYFLIALCGEKVFCPDYLFHKAPLDKVLNSGLLRRAAAYYFLCKVMRHVPLDRDGIPNRDQIKNPWNTDKLVAERELGELTKELKDFIIAAGSDGGLVSLLEFLQQARQWVLAFRNGDSDRLLRRKVAYVVSNAHFFLYDFVNRKRDFEGDIYAKLFMPSINVIPRSGNLFSVLRRWNSSSPMIMRTRKLAVSLRDNTRPEDLRHVYDLRCHAEQHLESKGGGYFLRWNEYGIVIDPGIFFFENFLEFYSINDINLIIITHDHPDHTMDLKSVFTLLNESMQEGQRRELMDFWIDPSTCAEFYNEILKLRAIEEVRANKELAEDVSPNKKKPRLIGNVYPFYRDLTRDQNSPNQENVRRIPEKGIELRAIHNPRHHTIGHPNQSFGILIALHEGSVRFPPSDNGSTIPPMTLYVTGDGGYDGNATVEHVKQALSQIRKIESDAVTLDILVAHVGSIHDGDLTDTERFDTGVYKTHLGMRGLVSLIDKLKPTTTIVSEFGEEMDTFRKRFCTMVDIHRQISDLEGKTLRNMHHVLQADDQPRSVIPGDVGFTLWMGKLSQGSRDEAGKQNMGFICRLCFKPHLIDDMNIHTSGQVLLTVCGDCRAAIFDPFPEISDARQPSENVAQEAADLLVLSDVVIG